MSGQSPPRSRRAQPQAGQIHSVQQRETSRSPSIVERTTRQGKSQSMPLGPSTTTNQLYSHNNSTQQSLLSLGQSSPPISNGPRRSPPPGQVHRMLPTPPHPQLDPTQDRRSVSPGTLHQHLPSGVQTHNPRPMYNTTARVLDKYQNEQWDYPDQLIQLEPPSVQQQHGIPQAAPPLPHLNSYSPATSYSREETVSPPKDPVERVRVTERASPKDLDLGSQRRREQTAARESPKTRDRQQVTTSPSTTTFSLQNHSHTPENRSSPYHAAHGSQGDYTPYMAHDQPTIGRRNTISMAHQPEGRTQQAQQQSSMPSQTPPAVMSTRADRSLPVQEEAEDDVGPGSKSGPSARDSWKNNDALLDQQRTESPHHDDDLTCDEAGRSRYDTSPHPSINGRDEKTTRISSKDDLDDHRYGDRDHTAEEYTPRSPTSTLPENLLESFQPPPTTVKMGNARARPRSGPTDQLGLRGLDTLVEQNAPPAAIRDPNPPPPQPQPPSANDQGRQQQFSHRRPVPDIGNDQMQQQPPLQQPLNQLNQQQQQHNQQQQQQHSQPTQQSQQQQQQNQQTQQHSPQQHYRGYDPRDSRYSSRGYYMQDELHNYPDDASVYFQSYIQSPRPDAPIPPTPHSQSAAPSPSPLITGVFDGRNNRDMYSPIAPIGSPYPYPFGHVRRSTQFGPSANNSHNSNGNHPNGNAHGQGGGPQNIDQAMLREQYAKQWQIFAQNNNWGAMSDSTFSPAPTPFQRAFSPWAHWHTQKLFGRIPHDAMSMQSSPSHEPVPLPGMPPVSVGAKRGQVTKERGGSKLRREASVSPPRKPPPRVESTQPRDTSPEPSSSGEETAGEDSYPTPQSSYVTPGSVAYDERWAGAVVPVAGEEDEADWVDEDEELDPEDLLDLDYHPSYVRTPEKRRRRWEIGWETLTHAFQNLDRQTDATMVLVASPPDSSKLHIISSRSVRRTPVLNRSPAMTQLKASFRGISQHRRQMRARKLPMIDHLLMASSLGDGSDGTSESREVDLRRALDAALSSLDVLKNMYEHRVARWDDEMTRMHQERENVEFFLKQLYGDKHPVNALNGPLVSVAPP